MLAEDPWAELAPWGLWCLLKIYGTNQTSWFFLVLADDHSADLAPWGSLVFVEDPWAELNTMECLEILRTKCLGFLDPTNHHSFDDSWTDGLGKGAW